MVIIAASCIIFLVLSILVVCVLCIYNSRKSAKDYKQVSLITIITFRICSQARATLNYISSKKAEFQLTKDSWANEWSPEAKNPVHSKLVLWLFLKDRVGSNPPLSISSQHSYGRSTTPISHGEESNHYGYHTAGRPPRITENSVSTLRSLRTTLRD